MSTYRHLFTAMALGSWLVVGAQTLTQYRCWFDDDPGTLVNNAISGQQFTLSSVNTDALALGPHRVTLQFKDAAGRWSAPFTTTFVRKGSALGAWRYWFDDDPATLQTGAAGGGQYTLASINADALALGPHRVTVQLKDNVGAWGPPVTNTFVRRGEEQIAWQYWFDDDVATLVNTTVAPNNTLSVITTIDASALVSGSHLMTFRTKDEHGGYSVPVTYAFDVYTGFEEIPGLDRVVLMPNPTSDVLYARFDTRNAMAITYDVVDATGRQVLGAQRFGVSGSAQLTIDLGGLAPGRYHLRLIGARGIKQLPVLKQ